MEDIFVMPSGEEGFSPEILDFHGRYHETRHGMIYMAVRAISSIVNLNYDGWPAEELEKAYKTFRNDPIFVDHNSERQERARGMVIDSQFLQGDDSQDAWIELLLEIDYLTFPQLGEEILAGGLDSVSMGANVGETECSYCGHLAYGIADTCSHVKSMKGEMIGDVLVYEICRDIDFYEISLVFEPADVTALAKKVYASADKQASFDKTAVTWTYVPETYKVDMSPNALNDEPPVEAFPFTYTNDENPELNDLFQINPYVIIDDLL